ncbi:MAG: HAMP domain-containing histidine kinase [Actinobacteria bacterium]|nr:HAMP domain-containing histidine kinase [Actinomycetota bacterium]
MSSELEELREVIAMVTHQLKTPLTSLLGYASVLRRKAEQLTTEQQQEYIGVIEEQAGRILKLVEELLASARLETAKGLQRKPLDLAGLARDIGAEFATARDREISVDAPSKDLGLFGDPGALEHVIGNLLDNAIKYSDPGSAVVVVVSEGEGEVFVSVSDEGRGIDREQLELIFERYHRASDEGSKGSAGLGLYIVRNLVAAHGGRVWAESEVGKGTVVTFSLPRRRG